MAKTATDEMITPKSDNHNHEKRAASWPRVFAGESKQDHECPNQSYDRRQSPTEALAVGGTPLLQDPKCKRAGQEKKRSEGTAQKAKK